VRSCQRVGIRPFGPHRPRHTVAWDLLTDGVSLNEIGQLLRHRSQCATAVCASVEAVRPCLPEPYRAPTVDRWPEGMGLFLA
jgi:site-specific recombinase XerD